MSANIYYRPVKSGRHSVGAMAPSSFIKSIEKALGRFPLTLVDSDIPVLQGMSATQSEEDNPYNDLIKGIEKYGEIEVFAEY